VQRVPVRIALNPEEVNAHPLRVGLSMETKVDVSKTEGKTLADAPRTHAVAQTDVFDKLNHDADGEVQRIIAANAGGRSSRMAAASQPARNVAKAGSPSASTPATPAASMATAGFVPATVAK
jgi:membrane fusion protein (multidrug efflux system)